MTTATGALYLALRSGTLAEFEAVYPVGDANAEFSGRSALSLAVSNRKGDGPAIAARLLDDGADPRAGQPLHDLLAGNKHDVAGESALLERLLDLGADVNQVSPRDGTPLETIAAVFKFTDEQLAPFFDVLLARPDLDLTTPSLHGRSAAANLLLWRERRPALAARVEAVLAERGQSA